jgi:acyl-CoA synthetase (AMP-forming)/AMP-acid ligase II
MTDNIIGKSIKRIDALGKVTGQTLYPGDRAHEHELWLKILFARRPHARIIKIDSREAEALPGVMGVLTAKDVPVNQYGLQIPDQPVLCGPESNKKGGDIVRFVGDQVAIVIAENEKIAAQARDLIRVEYEDLPGIYDPIWAMSGQAPQLHPGVLNNIADYKRIRKGETEAAFNRCQVIIEGVYRTPFQEHAYLQPEAGTAYMDDEGYIYIQDRIKDMIISGGENVYPAEIENILMGDERIAEAAVIGQPSARWGESPFAIVVRKDAALREQDVIEFCRGRLAGYKQPRGVAFVTEIPRNPSGKILKRILRDRFPGPAPV